MQLTYLGISKCHVGKIDDKKFVIFWQLGCFWMQPWNFRHSRAIFSAVYATSGQKSAMHFMQPGVKLRQTRYFSLMLHISSSNV